MWGSLISYYFPFLIQGSSESFGAGNGSGNVTAVHETPQLAVSTISVIIMNVHYWYANPNDITYGVAHTFSS